MNPGKAGVTTGAVAACLLLSGCVTGKGIRDAEDIRDDGKSNIALLTYNIDVFVTEKHSSERDTTLAFKCPDNNAPLGAECFNVNVPYKGTKVVDGFGLHAFESNSAKAIKLKYGSYGVESVLYRIVTERVPETSCVYSKKSKRDVCTTRMKDKTDNHSISFPEPMNLTVSPGAGCYIGHLKLTVVDDQLRSYELDSDSALSEDKLDAMQADLSAAVLQQVDGACR